MPSYLGTSRLVRRRRGRDPGPGRRLRRRHRRDPGRRRRAGAGRRADPLPGLRVLHAVLPPVVTGAVVMLIGFNLAPVVADIYWPQDQWVALLTMTFVILVAVGAARLPGPHRDLPRPDLRLPAVLAARRRLRPDHRRSTRRTGKVDTHDRLELGGRQGRRLVRLPAAQRRWPPASPAGTAPTFSVTFVAAGAAGRHRADRREHRPRQGGRRDDRPRPRPGDGPRDRRRRRRHRARHLGRRLADHDVRREHRRHGGDPGLLHGGVLRGRDRGDPVRPLPEVRRRSCRPPPAACSAASPSCSTA